MKTRNILSVALSAAAIGLTAPLLSAEDRDKVMQAVSGQHEQSAATPASGFAWGSQVEQALDQARAQDKDVLIHFTGSDWCSWCHKLDDEVIATELFRERVPEAFVGVQLDFPQATPQSPQQQAYNAQWAQRLGVQGFPTVALMDQDGRVYAITGYQPGGAEPYVEHLADLRQVRAARDEALAEAESQQGTDRAASLMSALEAVGPQVAALSMQDEAEQIIGLDRANAAGLREQVEPIVVSGQMRDAIERAMPMLERRDFDGAFDALAQSLEHGQTLTPVRQMLMAFQADIRMQQGQASDALALIDRAIAVAPDSEVATQLKAARDRHTPLVSPAPAG